MLIVWHGNEIKQGCVQYTRLYVTLRNVHIFTFIPLARWKALETFCAIERTPKTYVMVQRAVHCIKRVMYCIISCSVPYSYSFLRQLNCLLWTDNSIGMCTYCVQQLTFNGWWQIRRFCAQLVVYARWTF